ncbi:nonsense-mediated mRNA decay factor SMG9 [Capsicum galapagoense]
MAGSGGNPSSNQSSVSHQAPKILLAKPGLVTAGKFNRGGPDDDSAAHRPRLPSVGSLNLLSDTWDFHTDRFLPFLTDNTDFTVVGVIGPPGVGKSTMMNEIYGFDAASPGTLPPFAIEAEETRAMAKHCTVGIEPRVSSERIILLDTQPVFSPSVLAEMIRPDGSSTIPILSGESLSAELAHELLSIQLGVLLASICHIILVVSEGVHDASMWQLMSVVDLLKHGVPDPSSLTLSHPQSSEKENRDKILDSEGEYMAEPVFVHTKLRTEDLAPCNLVQLKKALSQFFCSSSFVRSENQNTAKESQVSAVSLNDHSAGRQSESLKLFLIPSRNKDDSLKPQYESHISALWNLRDQVLSKRGSSFSRTLSERDWLKNSAKIWEIIRNSSIIMDYCRTLQSSGMFRRL